MRKAFPVDGPPDPSTITTHFCPTCANLRATLGGLAGSAVPDNVLDETVTVIALLSPIAFRYYLPAFMCRAIASPLIPGVGASRVLDYVAMSLCLDAGDAWWLERMQGLTPPQRRVIHYALQRHW